MDKVLVHGIQFYGHHGLDEAERRLGQRYVVDVELSLDLRPAASSDDLAATADYEKVHQLVVEIGKGTSFHLIETLAERIASVLLERFPAKAVLVKVKKPSPPFEGALDFVGVEISRK